MYYSSTERVRSFLGPIFSAKLRQFWQLKTHIVLLSFKRKHTRAKIYIKVGSFRASFFLFKSPTASTTAKREERGGGLFFGERDRQTRFEIRSRRFFFSLHFPSRCRMYHWRASSSISLSSFRKHVRHRPMRDFRRHENQFEATVCGEQSSIVRD